MEVLNIKSEGLNIRRYKFVDGYIDMTHCESGAMPSGGKKTRFFAGEPLTFLRLNGEGDWLDLSYFKGSFMEYMHYREVFTAELIWEKMLV